MPIEIDKPVFVKYRDASGAEVDDVGYWILPRLSWQDFRAYMDMAFGVQPDAINPTMIDEIAEFLVAKGFNRFEGVLMDGVLLPKSEWKKAPGDLLMQMVRELQKRNANADVSHPNSSTPSAPASAGDGRALPESPQPNSESFSTPKPLPTESDSPVS